MRAFGLGGRGSNPREGPIMPTAHQENGSNEGGRGPVMLGTGLGFRGWLARWIRRVARAVRLRRRA